MGIEFVAPQTETLLLSDGASITIKKRLSHGERDEMYANQRPVTLPDGSQRTSKNIRSAKLVAYLVGWSASAPMSPDIEESQRFDTINNLDPDSFDEITKAIDAHIDAQAEEKKRAIGRSASVPISSSPAVLAGAMSG